MRFVTAAVQLHIAGLARLMEDVGEEERARRHAKRFAGLCAVKKTPAYIITTLRQRQRPTSPDPYDDRVSKRAWEKSMQQWRSALRRILWQIQIEEGGESASCG